MLAVCNTNLDVCSTQLPTWKPYPLLLQLMFQTSTQCKGVSLKMCHVHMRTGTFELGGAVTLLPEKNYTMPESMCCTNALKSQ